MMVPTGGLRVGDLRAHLLTRGVASVDVVCSPDARGGTGLVHVTDTDDVTLVAAALLDLPDVAAVEAGTFLVAFRVRAGEWS